MKVKTSFIFRIFNFLYSCLLFWILLSPYLRKTIKRLFVTQIHFHFWQTYQLWIAPPLKSFVCFVSICFPISLHPIHKWDIAHLVFSNGNAFLKFSYNCRKEKFLFKKIKVSTKSWYLLTKIIMFKSHFQNPPKISLLERVSKHYPISLAYSCKNLFFSNF